VWRRLPRRPLKVAIEVVVVCLVLLCVGLAVSGELGRLETESLRFAPGWFALATVGFVLLQLAHVELWRVQLAKLGSRLPPSRARAIWCASAPARYVPTSMLMPTVRIAMAERQGVPKRRCLASLVYEAALALAGALVVAGYFIVQLPELEGEPGRWLAIAIPLAALVAMHPRFFAPLSAIVLRRFRREPLAKVLGERALLLLWAGYALSFLLAGLALFALSSALYPVAAADLPQIVGAFAVGFTVSILAFVLPGGLGAREAALVAALAPTMPTVVAFAVAIIARVLQITIEIALAAITAVLARGAVDSELLGDAGRGPVEVPVAEREHAGDDPERDREHLGATGHARR
jgi:Lysylphosphatidylglycerol synthase TM region